jgi:dTDP-glucose 4,6-dehydratase
MDTTRIETELGWKPEESFESGLRATVEWYLTHPEWWKPILEGTYGGERLGLDRAAKTEE